MARENRPLRRNFRPSASRTHTRGPQCSAAFEPRSRAPILSARPSHRDQPQTPNDHRWKMLQLACAEHGSCSRRYRAGSPGKSYAVDTMREFRQANPGAQLCWILGMDSYRTLPTWQNWRELLQYGHLVVVQRPESSPEPDGDQVLNEFEQRYRTESIDRALAGNILFLTLPMKAVSASQIRCRRRAGESDKALLDTLVWSYINQHQLYQPRRIT